MYADVIVDISHEAVDRIFQYRIPAELLSDISIGSPVCFPFGKGNRLTKGYVVSVSETTDYPVEKIKNIISIDEGALNIESKLIELASWMHKRYGSTMIQALKTVLPIKKEIRHKENKYIVLKCDEAAAKEALDIAIKKKHKAKERLLTELISAGELSYELVCGKLGISSSTIKALEDAGIITLKQDIIYRNPSALERKTEYSIKKLTFEQQNIVDDIFGTYTNRTDLRPKLIHGVTGSGKTEVYMEIVAKMQSIGRQSIILIPEIALTYQTIMRFYSRFGDRVSILHSRMSAGEKYDQFERAKSGQIDIIIGPRSALFTPFPNLGLIVIDEEHEGTYKSETMPRYHAREVAKKLTDMSNGILVLGSATPAVESFYKAKTGEYCLYTMSRRVNNNELPAVNIVNLKAELEKGNRTMFSEQLRCAIEERLKKKEQVMLFINRRGYAGFVSCRSCGEPIKCPHCDVSLTYHNNGHLICHYCNYNIKMPNTCPKCSSKYIGTFGTGTQKIEEAVNKIFPSARTVRMDMDTTSGKDGHDKILSTFANQEADILIGTQMIVKGHDFPNVTLVGIMVADMSLFENDYKSSERTFQLLTQAAGRAGRGAIPGEVIIQTYNPEHYALEAASKHDFYAFYEKELSYRQLLNYPPFYHILVIFISSPNATECGTMIDMASDYICKTGEYEVIGPSDAIISKKRDHYRKTLFVKHDNISALTDLMESLDIYLKSQNNYDDVLVQYDLDPMNTY